MISSLEIAHDNQIMQAEMTDFSYNYSLCTEQLLKLSTDIIKETGNWRRSQCTEWEVKSH